MDFLFLGQALTPQKIPSCYSSLSMTGPDTLCPIASESVVQDNNEVGTPVPTAWKEATVLQTPPEAEE